MLRKIVTALAMAAIFCCGIVAATSRPAIAQSDDDDGGVASPDCKCMYKPVPKISGNHTGTIDDPDNGTGALTVTLPDQHRRRISGTWSVTFSNGQSNSGAVSGLVGQKSVNIKFHTSDPSCVYHATATIGTNSLKGTMATGAHCNDPDSGNFEISD